MQVLERFRKALQHRNQVLLPPTRPRDRRTRECLAPTFEIEAEEVEVDGSILMGDEKCLTPRYHACNVHPHHHLPPPPPPPPPSPPLALQHGVLQRRRYVNIAFCFYQSPLLYYSMAGKSPRWEGVTGFIRTLAESIESARGKRSLQTTWSRKASTSIVLLTELYTSENAINFGCSSAHCPQ